MKDYIERQAAIDKVYRLKTRIARRRYVGITDEVIDMLDDLVGDIDDIPSAEIAIPVKQITKAIVDKYGEMVMPSADAVEVVRCKDCKHRPIDTQEEGNGFDYEFPEEYGCPGYCDDGYYSQRFKDDFYCGFGERADT